MDRFAHKTAIVTGAGSGIGAATAERFAQEGANVVLIGRTRAKLERTAGKLDQARTLVHEADVSDLGAVQGAVAAAVRRFGGLDVLVNNAGVGISGSFIDTPLDRYRTTMAINVDGVVYGCRAALPHLLESRGAIVTVSSVSGLGGDWGLAFYNASKGAISNLTRALALEFASRGVRVNAVAPSLTETDMTEGFMNDEILMAKFKDRLPMGRGARSEEVAAAIAFLASADAGFVNGVVLPVDGGLSASNGQPNFM